MTVPRPPKRVLHLEAPRTTCAELTFDRVRILFYQGKPIAFQAADSQVVTIDRVWYQRPYPQRHINLWRNTDQALYLDTLEFTEHLIRALYADVTLLKQRIDS